MNLGKVLDYNGDSDRSYQMTLEGVDPFSASDDNPVKIDIVTDQFIDDNIKVYDLVPVTNPIPKEHGGMFTSDGIFSPYIFGVTQDEKKSRFSYIDLGCQVIHPYIFEIFLKVMPKARKIAMGQGSWKLVDGKPVEILEDDPDYDITQTGIGWIVDHWDDFSLENNTSRIRDQRLKLIKSYKKEDVIISKWLVIPVFYRELSYTNGIPVTPDIDVWYNNLIQYANSLRRSAFAFTANNTKWQIQERLGSIRKYGQSLVEKKHGFLKKSVLGKSTDYGFRSVISCVNMDTFELPTDNPVDIYSSGIPLAQCCIVGFPFVKAAVIEWLRQQFESLGSRFPAYNPKTKKVELIHLNSPMSKFTESYVQKKIEMWVNTPGARFRPVHVPTENGEMSFVFPGNSKFNQPNIEGPNNRVFTWTDLLYICAMDCLSDKHVYITRYPLVDYFGTFPSRIHILSTIQTQKMTVNGVNYDYYPVVNPDLPEGKVSQLFIDTITMSIPYLKGLGGDYDGDQVSLKMVFTQEANEEAEKILHSPKHFITEDKELIRVVANETYMTWYNITED